MTRKTSGCFILLTGLPCAGKTTIAEALGEYIPPEYLVANDSDPQIQILDGDVLRTGLCSDLGFSREDRKENLRRVAEIGKILLEHDMIIIGAFVAPYASERQMMRDIIGDAFYEVFVDAPLAACEARDVKGMYAKARAGKIKGFTGVDDPYERPKRPDLVLTTAVFPVKACRDAVIDLLIREGILT